VGLISAPPDDGTLAEAIGTLVSRYRSVVYGQALRVCRGNQDLADEVFQETFLRLFKWLRDRGSREPLHTFPRLLASFAHHAAVDVMRRELREAPTASEAEAWNVPAEGKEVDYETRVYLVYLLEHLDPRSKAVLELSYLQDLSAPEVGERLGLSPGNVRILRFRALEALRTLRKRDEIADSFEPL